MNFGGIGGSGWNPNMRQQQEQIQQYQPQASPPQKLPQAAPPQFPQQQWQATSLNGSYSYHAHGSPGQNSPQTVNSVQSVGQSSFNQPDFQTAPPSNPNASQLNIP